MNFPRFEVIDSLNTLTVPKKHPKHMKYYGLIVIWDHVKFEVKASRPKHTAIDIMVMYEHCDDLNRIENDRLLYLSEVFNYANFK